MESIILLSYWVWCCTETRVNNQTIPRSNLTLRSSPVGNLLMPIAMPSLLFNVSMSPDFPTRAWVNNEKSWRPPNPLWFLQQVIRFKWSILLIRFLLVVDNSAHYWTPEKKPQTEAPLRDTNLNRRFCVVSLEMMWLLRGWSLYMFKTYRPHLEFECNRKINQ